MTTMGWVVLGVGGWVLLSMLVALVVGRMIRSRDMQLPPSHEDRDASVPAGAAGRHT